jgi:tetratricopeptide (TPR) repeat protein
MSDEQDEQAAPDGAAAPFRVFISYAHDDAAHESRVRQFWLFLREQGIDARADLLVAKRRQDWAQWMTRQIRDADYVLVIASPEYKRRAEGDAGPGEGRGVQWEAGLIQERIYVGQQAGLRRVLPVVLPGCSVGDLPLWLRPASTTWFGVSEFTVPGAERLLRLLTGQPGEPDQPLGAVPVLGPGRPGDPAAGLPLRTRIVIEAALTDTGELASAVTVAGSQLCQGQAPLPDEVARVWGALRLPGVIAGERMADAGRRLAGVLLEDAGQALLAGVLGRLPLGGTVEVLLAADARALSLPVELIRLAGDTGEVGPLGLLPAVAVSRRLAPAGRTPGNGPLPEAAPSAGLAGPLKILAAVAAPDETKTPNAPLDIEAEMQAVLDAVIGVAGGAGAQLRVLEVASLAAIRQAIQQDAFHVLHLSAHGSPGMVELEDEDGGPVPVTPAALMAALRHAGRPVPLIVLWSGSAGSAGSEAMAAGLVSGGADRVIAMLAPVTSPYATTLARHLYQELAARPGVTAGQALAAARYLAAEDQAQSAVDRPGVPEDGVATLFCAGADGPLVDPAAPAAPLTARTTPPGGRLVRELPAGALIGRRAELRAAMAILRRTGAAVDRYGAAGGVVLTGIGGIGKTALAGRVISWLRDEGWLIVVHEGRWNPTALITAATRAIREALDSAGELAWGGALAELAAPGTDDGSRLAVIARLLATQRLLVVFDDFEQNLTAGGAEFADPAIDEVITGLADAATTGALLVTCRYPLPGPDRFLPEVPLAALSETELRRLFLRLPALRSLPPADLRLLTATIGGHPRMLEFTDALLRGGHSSLRHVQARLRNLADAEGIDLGTARPLNAVMERAMVLGSADILLTELTGLLTPAQAAILSQVAVCRAPMSLGDLAYAMSASPEHDPAGPGNPGNPAGPGELVSLADLRADVSRLADLTLLSAGPAIVMHRWTAALVTRNAATDLRDQHERALAMRRRQLAQRRGGYDDLLDVPRHLVALGRYDEIPPAAEQAMRLLPGTLATVAFLAEIRPQIPAAQRAWVSVALLEADALLSAGDLAAATRQLRAVHQQLQARAAFAPASARWQRGLSVVHSKLGDVAVAAGDLAAARADYQAGLEIAARLAAADPARTGLQRDLSVSHEKIGDVAFEAGDLRAARAAYQAGLSIQLALAAADPGDAGSRRDLSVSYNKIGDVAMEAGDLAGARAAYQAGLDIRLALAAADPGPGGQRDLSVSHDKVGDVAATAGDRAAARAAYQASLDIRLALAAADPANTRWQRDLSVSHNKIGDVAVETGDLRAARAAYQASLDIRLALAAADPANIRWQRDLSVSHDKIGDLAVAAGELSAARAAYQADLDIARRLAAADPANTRWQRDLSVSHDKIGDVAAAAGDLADARAAYEASLDIARRLVAADPANTHWLRDLSISHEKLGNVAAAAGDLAAARAAYEASLDITRQLAAANPANAQWQRDLQITQRRLDRLPAASPAAPPVAIPPVAPEGELSGLPAWQGPPP